VVSRQDYEHIQNLILSIIDKAGSSADPVSLLAQLRHEGIPRELGSTIMWEMIGAGHINQSRDWRLSREERVSPEAVYSGS
jgi:hypothetical protein